MPQSAYLTPRTEESLSLEKVKELLIYYQELTTKTGEQLSWAYSESAFPYTLTQKPNISDWFYLKGLNDAYSIILIGVSHNFIQVVLTDQSTHGDKAKANELCKFLASKLHADLTLFNGRKIQYQKK
ncbi:MAG: DUF1885 family protein [Anaerobacillus sp.]